jgi:hypothetical protein
LYCGARLPAAEAARRAPSGAEDALEAIPDSDRVLVIVPVAAQPAELLARALGTTAFEAAQLCKRGDYHLLRIAAEGEADAEAERLTAAGLAVVRVPEAEVLASRPRLVLGGTMNRERLHLRTEGGDLEIVGDEIMLVVQGPIARQYQTSAVVKRVRTATLEEGYRFHLHAKGTPRPLEIDPGGFEFGGSNDARSSLLAIRDWIATLARLAPLDDFFRRSTPALGPAVGKAVGRLGAVASLAPARGRSREGPLVLDNLLQFRFYSCWRAAVERRRR